MDTPEIRIGADAWPSEWLPSSSYAANVAYIEASPAETEAWTLHAVNRLRRLGSGGLPPLTSEQLQSQIIAAVNSEYEALGLPLVRPGDPALDVAARAGMMTLLTRVFGLAFAPAGKES